MDTTEVKKDIKSSVIFQFTGSIQKSVSRLKPCFQSQNTDASGGLGTNKKNELRADGPLETRRPEEGNHVYETKLILFRVKS